MLLQAVWALGNIAGDNTECRDIALSFGIMEPLLTLLQEPNLKLSTMRNATWTLSNLCRGKNPPPNLAAVSGVHSLLFLHYCFCTYRHSSSIINSLRPGL